MMTTEVLARIHLQVQVKLWNINDPFLFCMWAHYISNFKLYPLEAYLLVYVHKNEYGVNKKKNENKMLNPRALFVQRAQELQACKK